MIWTYYGIIKEDWFIIGANVPGAIALMVIASQFFCYRKKISPNVDNTEIVLDSVLQLLMDEEQHITNEWSGERATAESGIAI